MDDFFDYDPGLTGVKGIVFIGEKLLVYRRDRTAPEFALHIDLPGGGAEDDETPFETFKREVMEEFGLSISKENIEYARKYPSTRRIGRTTYFPVARLSATAKTKIVFGNEGLEYMFMDLDEYLNRKDAWPVYQERASDYANSLQ